MNISIRSLSKAFGNVKALDQVDMEIPDGNITFLLGPSGCGKTTLLRCIGGFEQPTSGQILFDGKDVAGIPSSQRNSAMVFQGYALWPHLTVRQNIAFGLEMQHLPKEEILRRTGEAMEQVRIANLADRKPNELSGGQQQRVALARTLVVHPGCLLLDEPLANLDATLRRDMRQEIRTLCRENHLTAVYVTHDRQEALAIADTVVILKDGRVIQKGTANDIYRRPVSAFVASFIGETNFLEGVVREKGIVETACGILRAEETSAFPAGTAVTVSIRPEAIVLQGTGTPSSANILPVTLKDTVYLGEVARHQALTGQGGVSLSFLELNPVASDRNGQAAELAVLPEDVIVLPLRDSSF